MGKPKLIEEVRRKIRLRHYSYRTEEAFVGWIRQYIRFQEMTHPRVLGDDAIEQFLSHLATTRGISASTQNQALAALLFLYQHVLGQQTEDLSSTRSHRTRRLPVVLSRREVEEVLRHLKGKYRLMGYFLYGSGLRRRECLVLRVKDVDVEYGQVLVRDGKGARDRVTILPPTQLVVRTTGAWSLVPTSARTTQAEARSATSFEAST